MVAVSLLAASGPSPEAPSVSAFDSTPPRGTLKIAAEGVAAGRGLRKKRPRKLGVAFGEERI